MEDKYKILLELLNRIRPMDLSRKAELYDSLIDVENHINNSGQIEPMVIRLPNIGDDVYCSVCKGRDIYEDGNKHFAVLLGNRNCHYCGNMVVLCKKHFELLRKQINELVI